jgi:hypothetical protein
VFGGVFGVLQSKALQYKSSLRQTAFVLIDPIADQSIGCSLKIHRVEISVAGGKHRDMHRAASDNFDCVKTDIANALSSNDEYLQDSNIEELFTLRHNA